MEAVPLIPKPKVLPNLDAVPLLRELFQDELEAPIPSKKLSENILTTLKHEVKKDEDLKPCGDKEYLENYSQRTQDIVEYSEHVLEAYEDHQKKLKEIREVEKDIFEAQAHYLKREKLILENPALRDSVCLKRQPLFKALSVNYVRKYKLLQADAGLPYDYEIKSDFRVRKFAEWRRRLGRASQEDFCFICFDKDSFATTERRPVKGSELMKPQKKEKCSAKQPKAKTEERLVEIFTTDPKILFFTNYKLGYVYVGHIKVKNTSPKPIQFLLKPMYDQSPFRVKMSEKLSMSVTPGLGFQLSVEFTPKSLDNAAEDIVIVTEDGNRFLIPLIAYLEPPILKTHKEINEFTKDTSERIASSYIECGSCFTGDSKVIKLNFRCYRGSGEFFIMSLENWNTGNINTVTFENLLEIPPFRVYPVFFKVEKDQLIDVYVEFTPKYSGMQAENIVIACDNGQIRFLDLIGDAVGWHSYYFSFQDSLLKELSVDEDDDVKVKYYLNFEDTSTNGKVEKVFCVSNNSDMTFEFQWKIREANIMSTQEKYLKLSKYQVKIDPENGTFEPKSVWEFLVTVTFNNAEIGNYRMVLREVYTKVFRSERWDDNAQRKKSENINGKRKNLRKTKRSENCHNYEHSLYVLNLPYQCIEEDNTIIQPTGLVRNLYSQSLYGEEEASALSPELTSLQGTYESLQESIKSYMEFQNRAQAAPKQDFCRTVCAANPGLCAKPLKKSKTLFNIGETLEDLEGGSRQMESNSESCTSNRDEKLTDMSPQRNEIIWDFVDILVDEVELWVEVLPTRVTLQPSIIDISNPICVNAYPTSKEVRIINHNRSPVTCSWVMPVKSNSTERSLDMGKTGSTMLSLLFDKNSLNKVPTTSVNDSENPKNSALSWNQSEEKGCAESVSKESEVPELWDISIKPCKEFIVPGLSELTCRIEIIAYQPGKINETFWLNINDGDLQLKMIIKGLAIVKDIATSPHILDFGVLKQGIRYTKNFTITSQCSLPLYWKINHFKFDFPRRKFLLSDVKDTGNIKTVKGVLAKNGNSITQSYCLNARAPGIKCSLIEVQRTNVKGLNTLKHYVIVLADVRTPNVWLSAPRFENAILAISGIMYVGQTHRTSVTLTNKGIVEAFLTWGHPFGCHCRKIKVEISPKRCRIERKQKLTIDFALTPLEEGIVNHCYIPCFFSRSAEPLILSVVGVVHTVNVTFEIIDYPMQNHADTSSFLKSPFYHTILRIPWPIKMYNPTLGLKFIPEFDILNLCCRCQEVEEEAAKAFHENKHECTRVISEKTTRSLKSFEMSDTGSSKSKSSFGKSIKILPEDEMQAYEYTGTYGSSLDMKKSEENSLCALSLFENAPEQVQFSKSHLEFLNVPFRTTILRQFVIRNETPIETNFQINVANYGVCQNLKEKRLEIIKNRVFGCCNDEFQNKLMQDQPLLFEVEPSEGSLKGFEAVCINVNCYGNTWGEYRDYLICQVRGIEPFNLKIFAQIVGHPLYFPNFKTNISQRATLRFEPLSPVERAVWKLIKVVNRSAIPLDVSWMVFLTKPLPNLEENEESNVDACTDSFATSVELNNSDEGSTQSSKNYIPKNTSDTAMESRDFSQNSESKNLSISESISSVKKEKKESGVSEKKSYPVLSSEEVKSDTHLQFPGVLDINTFQVKPKEMSFNPFEEKKIMITFNPDNYRMNPQEIKGVLTGCVKLKPEHENCPGLYYRPCGIGFVSELLDFSAAVEVPIVSFDIQRGDLRFIVDSNAVIKSEKKTVTILRKFFIKNLNSKSICLKIEVIPGTSFEVKKVNMIDKFYPEYNSKCHPLQVEGGHIVEMELQCTVSYKNVMYAFEQLKINRLKEGCSQSPQLGETKRSNLSKNSNDDNELDTRREPWKHYGKNKANARRSVDYSKLMGHNDSFHINVHRMSSRSDNSTCYDYHERKISTENEGEYLDLSVSEELSCKPEPPKHSVVSKEEIVITHSGTVTQTLVAELHISFPSIKISPKNLDFGNVYLGETGIRYCTLINLTGFPVNYRVLAKFTGAEFLASPLTGNLPSANYNCGIGTTLTVKFTPSQPGNYNEVFYVYCNTDLEFDFFELSVSGFGTWNEKYKNPKYVAPSQIETLYSKRSK